MIETPNPTPVAQILAVARHETRRLLRARHGLTRLGALFLPFMLALLAAAIRIMVAPERGPSIEEDQGHLAVLFRLGHLRWIVFLASVGLFGGLFSGERAERTLHYLFLQPVRRSILAAGKYCSAVLLLWTAALVSWILTTVTWLLPHGLGGSLGSLFSVRGLQDMFAYGTVLLLAAIAYGGVFLFVGTLVKSPPIVAILLLAWEALCSLLPVAFQRFTVFYWLDSLLPTRPVGNNVLAVLAEPAPWPLAVLACLLIGAAGVAGAAWRAKGMELSYGATE